MPWQVLHIADPMPWDGLPHKLLPRTAIQHIKLADARVHVIVDADGVEYDLMLSTRSKEGILQESKEDRQS